MRNTLEAPSRLFSPALDFLADPDTDKKDVFRERFRCSLQQCLRHGFHVEECFGVIWDETVQEVGLGARDQNEMFPELIVWARRFLNDDTTFTAAQEFAEC